MQVRVHAVEDASRANGPGLRTVVWFQGCTLGCPGCYNPWTHASAGGYAADTTLLAEHILAHRNDLEGVSFSGGEPFQQPAALLDLLQRLSGSGLSALAFSGYTLAEIQQQLLGTAILQRLDALIAGRYVQAKHFGHGLLGSSNQRIHLLSDRYTAADFAGTPVAEIILHADGHVTLTGISPPSLGLAPS